MAKTLDLSEQPILERPAARGSIWGYATILAALGAVSGALWAWERGYRPWNLMPRPAHQVMPLVEVDQGDIVEYVVENGVLESAGNAIVRCEVEALIGLVGGASGLGGSGGIAGRSGLGQGTTGTGGGGGQTSGAGGGLAATPKASTAVKSRAGGTATARAGTSAGSAGATARAGASSGASGGGGTATATAGAATAMLGGGKPMIRSFSYRVIPHMPLRPSAGRSTTTTAARGVAMDAMRGGGGGGGRGGRGGGGGGMFEEEKPGSTRILSILPEGTRVEAGDLVCTLDSSAFEDERKAQLIRHAQAKAWVDQARAILEVEEITLREYRDGIFPQDMQLIRQYIHTCQIEKERAERNLEWSMEMSRKGLQTSSQLLADRLAVQQATIALDEANGMLHRLERFTAPKLIKSLEAKLEAIRADKLAQEEALALETERLERLERNIRRCTLYAPRDGVVVYVNQTNGWGRVTQPIEQGVTVREGQPIFELPDPQRLRVKARINETKVGRLYEGVPAIIKIDAFPERPLRGTVAEVTAISTPFNGPFSDVRVYYATVNLEQGFSELRPGLTAEVMFRTNSRRDVARLPVSAVRTLDGRAFVAVPESPTSAPGRGPGSWRWQPVKVGLSDPDFVEIVAGVRRGDRVAADPYSLNPPAVLPALEPEADAPELAAVTR